MLRGQIILWYGSLETIPDGWALCDGTNGTPDLGRKFVRGSNDIQAPGSTGGTNTHVHDFTGDGHYHSILGVHGPAAAGSNGPELTSSDPAVGTTDLTNHLPSYHSLAYIMKLQDDPDPAFQAAFPYAAKAIVQFIMVGVNLEIYLTFKHEMNVDNKPANGLWLCELDGVPDAVDTSTWLDPWTMKLDINAPGGAPSNVTVEYDGPDENLATVWDKQWEPWGPIQGTDLA